MYSMTWDFLGPFRAVKKDFYIRAADRPTMHKGPTSELHDGLPMGFCDDDDDGRFGPTSGTSEKIIVKHF